MNGDDRRASEQQCADEPVGEAVRLDGNAAAGIQSEVFVPDITTTRATCANRGTIRALGALPVYGQGMGAVMRRQICDAVVLRVTRTPTRNPFTVCGFTKALDLSSSDCIAMER